jgi:hypothetical protein
MGERRMNKILSAASALSFCFSMLPLRSPVS